MNNFPDINFEGLAEAIFEFNKALERLSTMLLAGFAPLWSKDDYRRREARIRKLLDIENDADAPEWVQRVNQQRVDTFGSGNGRID